MPVQPARCASLHGRVLVIAPHNSYRTTAFVTAAHRLGVGLLFASQGKHSIVDAFADGLHVDFEDPRGALKRILREHTRAPFCGVVGTDDSTIELAAVVARELKLPHNQPQAVRTANRKDLSRSCLEAHGLPVPGYRRINLRQPLAEQAALVRFPCVLKPLNLSASRGVIRADDRDQFVQAGERIGRLLEAEQNDERDAILAEDFIPGFEVAIEGMLVDGVLEVLALFDKPEPLNGPYFEETYYVTPSRLNERIQALIQQTVGDACRACGLREGPIHAECRVNEQGVWILELAARTIGGLCARLLDVGTGRTLEELVIAHATGQPFRPPKNDTGGAGVLMIPTPAAGILRRVEGLQAALHVPFIEDITILVREGYRLVPWPEGSQYFGFIFSLAPTARQAELALRQAHSRLNIVVAPVWDLQQDRDRARTRV